MRQNERKPRVLINILNVLQLGKTAVLCGRVYGHPNFDEGERIYTSKIIRRMKSGALVSRNTIYYPTSDVLYA